eukprot:4049325-Pleurochrysis_carterae.AAC.1
MSASAHRMVAAAARSAALSSCRAPSKRVFRVLDRSTGTQRVGSAQSQMTPRAHGAISDCSMTSVGTGGTSASSPAARRRSAAAAASARANQAWTRPQ